MYSILKVVCETKSGDTTDNLLYKGRTDKLNKFQIIGSVAKMLKLNPDIKSFKFMHFYDAYCVDEDLSFIIRNTMYEEESFDELYNWYLGEPDLERFSYNIKDEIMYESFTDGYNDYIYEGD